MTVKQLGNLLNPKGNGELGDLVQRARDMGELTQMLAGQLPAEFRASLAAANLREDGELVLICHSPAWASRLRFEEAAIRDACTKIGVQVEKISVRVGRVDAKT
jgi:hypothetical protein